MSLEVDNMCRTCLTTGSALLSMFECKTPNQQSGTGAPSIADMLKSITTITISDGDGMPSKVCLSCISEINRAFYFKIKCENSDFTLKQYIIQHVDQEQPKPKEESLVFDCDQLEEKVETINDTREDDQTTISGEIEQQKSPLDDDQVSLIFADDEDFHDENQDSVENTTEIYSVTTVDLDNSAEESTDMVQNILLECAICNQKFEDNNAFQCHAEHCSVENDKISEESKENNKVKKEKEPLKCPHCPIDFVHPRNLDKHIKRCHERVISLDGENADENDILSAEESEDASKCGGNGVDDDIDVAEDLVEEVKHQPAELPETPYKCMQCGAGFAKEKSLNFHFKLNKCKEKQFECLVCRRVFISRRNLIHHMKSHSTFRCGKCLKTFSRKDKLKSHNDLEHKGLIKNQCSLCGKVFTMLSTLKDHLRTHSGEKPFLCSICGKGFSQNTNLKQHLMRHSKIKPFKCNQCDYTFVSKGELNAHIRKHTGDHPFVCNTCGTGFTTSSSLVKHRRIHTGERPYACEFCPMRFSALGTLKNHRRTHTGEKPFVCKFCERAFAQKSDCVTHMRSHTGERPYICTVCGLSFSKSSAMKSHMLNHAKKAAQGSSNQTANIENNTNNSMDVDICELSESNVYQTPDELKGEILQR